MSLLQIVGVAIGTVVLFWVLILLRGSFDQYRNQNAQHELSQNLLSARVEMARVQRRRIQQLWELSWQGYRKFEVRRKVYEGESGICSFDLFPHDGRPLPPYQPGQFLTFQLDIAGQTKPTVRCYSLSDCYRDGMDHYRVSIKKTLPPLDDPDAPPGLASTYFHQHVQEGDILDVKAPAGTFVLDTERHTPVVLIAGGIGLTPLLSMLNAIVEGATLRETWLFYGVRNHTERIMTEHLDAIRRQFDNVHIRVCYSHANSDEIRRQDYVCLERISTDLLKRELPSNNFSYYLCGTPPMMRAISQGLKAWGVPAASIKTEAFGPASVTKRDSSEEEAHTPATAFTVTFSRSRKKAKWDPTVGSLLELAHANGVNIDCGCRAGSCGTCRVAIRTGDVEYLQRPDADVEAGTCLTCIAVPKGHLELDA